MPVRTFGQLIDRNTPTFDNALGQVQQFAHDLRSSIIQRQQAEDAFNKQLSLEDFKHENRLEILGEQQDFQREMAGVEEIQEQQKQAQQAFESARKEQQREYERITREHPEIREFNLHHILPTPEIVKNPATGFHEVVFVTREGERIARGQYEEFLSKMQEVGSFLDDAGRNFTKLKEQSEIVSRTGRDGLDYNAVLLGQKEVRDIQHKFYSQRTPEVMMSEVDNILSGRYFLNVNVDPEDGEPQSLRELDVISGRLISAMDGPKSRPAMNLKSTGKRVEFDGVSIRGALSSINAHIQDITGLRPSEFTEDEFENLDETQKEDVIRLQTVRDLINEGFNQLNIQDPGRINDREYQFKWWAEDTSDVSALIEKVGDTERSVAPAGMFFKEVKDLGLKQLN